MSTLSDFPISNKWPAQSPEILQLYSFPTPNGRKISIALEEMEIPYEPHLVRLSDDNVKSPEFLSLNPNNKIPAIVDPNGPDGAPLGLFESGAILIYLAEKSGKFLPTDAAKRAEVIQWLMWQMGGLGPMLGQLGFFFKFAGSEIEDPRPRNRYIGEANRLLNVLNIQLEGRDWVAGDYSIADMAIAPWLVALTFYGAEEAVDLASFSNVTAYIERFNARPAVQRGLFIPEVPGR